MSQPDYNANGILSSITTGSNVVLLDLFQDIATSVVVVSGTFSGTLQFEGSGDGDTTWAAQAGSTSATPGTFVTSTTGTGQWRFAVAGLTSFRVRMSSFASGAATISIQSGRGSPSTGTSGGGGGGGVTSFTGDGTLITNSASTGAVTATLGTLPAAAMPALTGDVTSSAGTVATSVVKVNGAIVPLTKSFLGSNGSGQFIDASATVISAAQLPNPSASTLGGVESYAAVTNQWINTISTSGIPASSQPTLDQIASPVANATFTLPSANLITIAGTAPVSSGSSGTNASALLAVNGAAGGATSITTAGTGGIGGSPSITAGAGGAATGIGGNTTVGGAGGAINFTAGAGGAGSAGNNSGGAGGNVIITSGAGGAKTGTGTAGTGGVINLNGITINSAGTTISGISGQQLNIAALGGGFVSVTPSLAVASSKFGISSTGLVSTYNNITTVSNGIPSEYATIDLTGQTAAKTATALYTPAATGMFRVSYYAKVTTASDISSVLGGTTGLVLAFTDGTDSVAQTAFTLPATSQAGNSVTIASGNPGNTTQSTLVGDAVFFAKIAVGITYAFGYTDSHTSVAMAYELHIKLEAL